MITNNKTKDVFLTKKQLEDRDKAGTLEEGVIYNTTDENAGHSFKVVDGVLQLLDIKDNVISEANLPPEYDTAELDIKYNEDGTLTDEQITYLKSFKNLMYIVVPGLVKSHKWFFQRVKTTYDTSGNVITWDFTISPNLASTIGGAVCTLHIIASNKKYTWNVTSVASYSITSIKYNVNGTLSAAQLSNIVEFLSAGSGWLLHLTISASNIGFNYLTYTSYEITKNQKITFISEGYKTIVLDLSTGAYTFEYPSVLPIMDENLDTIKLDTSSPNIYYYNNALYAKVEEDEIYGVDGVGASSTDLTRTDDNVGLTADSDELFNFFVNNEKVVDSNGNRFVELKKFYVKITRNSNGSLKYQVSHSQIDGNYFLCPMFKENGRENEYVFYGKYKGVVLDGKLCSKENQTPTYNKTIDEFMTYARNNGEGYFATDWAAAFTAQIMFMIVYASTKYEDYFTSRDINSRTGVLSTSETLVGIEDVIGNGFEFLVNIARDAGTDYDRISYLPNASGWTPGDIRSNLKFTNYATTNGYQSKHLLNPDHHPASMFPTSNGVNGTQDTYYCDYFTADDETGKKGSQVVIWGANGSTVGMYGMFRLDCSQAWNYTNTSVGSRLCAYELV